MTTEESEKLMPGDIVEFDGEVAYHLFKLVKKNKKGDWLGVNNGKHLVCLAIMEYPERHVLVGHSTSKHF